jgi:Chromo (CHRromatin Organisation MOdifier) domain
VEEILDSHLYQEKLEYLIKWRGYGPEWNSWVPEEDAEGARKLIDKFHRKHPGAPRRISAMAWKLLPFHKYSRPHSGKIFDWHTGQLVEMTSLKEGGDVRVDKV